MVWATFHFMLKRALGQKHSLSKRFDVLFLSSLFLTIFPHLVEVSEMEDKLRVSEKEKGGKNKE